MVGWEGPRSTYDYIRVFDATGEWQAEVAVGEENPLELRLPWLTGDFTLAYVLESDVISESIPITLTPAPVSITAPATAPSTPPTMESRRPPMDEPATAPTTPPATPPVPFWLPSTVTARTATTVASTTVDMRCASWRLMTSGLLVAQPARAITAARARAEVERSMGNPSDLFVLQRGVPAHR
jgi:hypothetical protein